MYLLLRNLTRKYQKLYSSLIHASAGLTGMFTLASSLLNIFTLPSGAMLDALGPRATAAVFGGLATFGCWIYSLGPENDTNYTVGFILMSLSGPYIFNCTMSFGNLAASPEVRHPAKNIQKQPLRLYVNIISRGSNCTRI